MTTRSTPCDTITRSRCALLGHNFTNYFEFRPDKNANAEEDDGRNLVLRYATLPLFYVVTGAGLVGLWRARRRPGAEPLLVQAAYFTVACLATIAVPRLRALSDLPPRSAPAC